MLWESLFFQELVSVRLTSSPTSHLKKVYKNNLIEIFYEAGNFTKSSDIEILIPVKGTPTLISLQGQIKQ